MILYQCDACGARVTWRPDLKDRHLYGHDVPVRVVATLHVCEKCIQVSAEATIWQQHSERVFQIYETMRTDRLRKDA